MTTVGNKLVYAVGAIMVMLDCTHAGSSQGPMSPMAEDYQAELAQCVYDHSTRADVEACWKRVDSRYGATR